MSYSTKLQVYFKQKNLSQKEVAEKLGVSTNMISRYIRGESEFSSSFIVRLVAEFPDIDLQYIFSEQESSMVKEPSAAYVGINVIDELSSIQERIDLIKESMIKE